MISEGQVKSRNFYWLSTREETIDWGRQEEDPTGEYDISTWAPTKTFADYTALNTLPRSTLTPRPVIRKMARRARPPLPSTTRHRLWRLAVHLKVNKSSSGRVSREGEADNEILPVLWQDNYFALLPGETRQVTATYQIGR